MTNLPEGSAERKLLPVTTGVLDYFPLAIAYVAWVSKVGNDKHNPGQPLHWARGKSDDHPDCIGRHLLDRGQFDAAGMLHDGGLAWRALANLQLTLEALQAKGLNPFKPFGGKAAADCKKPTVELMPHLTGAVTTIDEHSHGDDHHAHEQATKRENHS